MGRWELVVGLVLLLVLSLHVSRRTMGDVQEGLERPGSGQVGWEDGEGSWQEVGERQREGASRVEGLRQNRRHECSGMDAAAVEV